MGRIMALCSRLLTITWSPGLRKPLSSMFSPAVMPGVNTAWVMSSVPKSVQSRSRHSISTISASLEAS